MNDATLIRKSLFRKKTRAILLVLSIMTAFLIFAVLGAFSRSLNAGVETAAADRLVTLNAINFTLDMPYAYYSRVAGVEGVEEVTHANWFGGYFQDPRNVIQAFAVEMESYLAVYDELVITEGDLDTLLTRNDCMALGADLAGQYEWSVGERIPLSSNIWSQQDGARAWDMEVCVIFDADDQDVPANYLIFHYDYFNEALAFNRDRIGWIILTTGDPAINDQVARAIDAQFANSPAETETATEAAFGQAFLEQIGNIGLILTLVIGAAFATILMIVGTTMVMAINERTKEVAVMKTLGFSPPRIFAHVLSESVLLSVLGGLLGLGLAAAMVTLVGGALAGFLPGFRMTAGIVLQAVALMVAFGLVTGLLPAVNAMRLNIVDGLGKD
ncbi:MAG: FtsX-like permease family protein [Oceanicaulis sp.]